MTTRCLLFLGQAANEFAEALVVHRGLEWDFFTLLGILFYALTSKIVIGNSEKAIKIAIYK